MSTKIWTPCSIAAAKMSSMYGDVYFVPAGRAGQIDAVFSSLHFERIHLPDEYEGIPQEVGTKLQSDIHDLDVQLQECREESAKLLNEYEKQSPALQRQIPFTHFKL